MILSSEISLSVHSVTSNEAEPSRNWPLVKKTLQFLCCEVLLQRASLYQFIMKRLGDYFSSETNCSFIFSISLSSLKNSHYLFCIYLFKLTPWLRIKALWSPPSISTGTSCINTQQRPSSCISSSVCRRKVKQAEGSVTAALTWMHSQNSLQLHIETGLVCISPALCSDVCVSWAALQYEGSARQSRQTQFRLKKRSRTKINKQT